MRYHEANSHIVSRQADQIRRNFVAKFAHIFEDEELNELLTEVPDLKGAVERRHTHIKVIDEVGELYA